MFVICVVCSGFYCFFGFLGFEVILCIVCLGKIVFCLRFLLDWLLYCDGFYLVYRYCVCVFFILFIWGMWVVWEGFFFCLGLWWFD